MSQSLFRAPRLLSRRAIGLSRPFSMASTRLSAWSPSPAPPRLPKEEQDLFEKLQQASTGAFSTPQADRPRPAINQADGGEDSSSQEVRVKADGDGEELHPNIRRGAPPEFEGERNPKTGEVGGPKNEPLRWGHGGDWSYNGRVTDF